MLLGLASPILWILWSAWTNRWLTDDGFINVRVVHQILDGNGPVFNAGERVEATSSALWVAFLVLGKLLFSWLPVEWIAVLLGIAMTVAAVALAIVSARRAYGTWRLLPIGAVVYVVLPPAGTFATAGLEMGLTLLWMASWYLLLPRSRDQPESSAALPAAFVLGLGPLIRPDLVVMSAVGICALLALTRPLRWQQCIAMVGAALALPAAYEVFRMCYYGNLLPNTAYTKEAITTNWAQGWEYLKDFSRPYWGWIPALIAVGVVAVTWGRVPGMRRRVALATPAVAGLAYGFFVIRGGADFMHGRMLLPAVFGLLLPIAAVPSQRATLYLLLITVLWAAVPITAGGPPYDQIGPYGITNERNVWVGKLRNPVTIQDFESAGSVRLGRGVRARSENGQHDVKVFTFVYSGNEPLSPEAPAFVQHGVFACCAIGMTSVAAGTGVYIADECGLASPIGSRLAISERSRPGHEKTLRPSWIFAMFGDPEAAPAAAAGIRESVSADEIKVARQALECPAIRRMLERARAPLTVDRMARNIVESFTDFGTRIDPDPAKELAHCWRQVA